MDQSAAWQVRLTKFPDLKVLTDVLSSLLCENCYRQVTVVERQPNVYAASYPSEIVTCEVDGASRRKLFCKYSAGHTHNAYGHRGDLAYEGEVYRHVLQPLQLSTPKFYGTHSEPRTGETWLILECLDNSVRISKIRTGIVLAAEWLGQFHAANERDLAPQPASFLHTYNAEYYLGWARRTSVFAGPLHQRFPWITTLCGRFEKLVSRLLSARLTVIHGEYYPHNILHCRGKVYPVDWESTAIAFGEIDLASLVEGWPADIVKQCKMKYQRARWPHGVPADSEQMFRAAQLYWFLRWLGNRPGWTTHEGLPSYLEQLRSAGEQLGLI